MCNSNKWCDKKDAGFFILRLIVGGIFLAHGIDKLNNINDVITFFSDPSIGLGAFWAWAVAIIETVGGAAIILGLFTRYVSILLAVVMIVAIIKVKLGAWQTLEPALRTFTNFIYVSEIDFALLGTMILLALSGPGSWSLTRWCKCLCHKEGKADCKVCAVIDCAKDDACGCDHGHKHDHEHHQHDHAHNHPHAHPHTHVSEEKDKISSTPLV